MFCSEHEGNGQSPETYYSKTVIFCDPGILRFPRFNALLCGLGQVQVRTNVLRFYAVVCGPHKSVKLGVLLYY